MNRLRRYLPFLWAFCRSYRALCEFPERAPGLRARVRTAYRWGRQYRESVRIERAG